MWAYYFLDYTLSCIITNIFMSELKNTVMLSNFIKSRMKELGISQDTINEMSAQEKIYDLRNNILSLQLTYDTGQYNRLAESATAFNKLSEYYISNNQMTDYFQNCYKEWICLILKTENGDIYDYTKREFVIAFRGLDVHNSTGNLSEKAKYLTAFLSGKNNPALLFFEDWNEFNCITDESDGEMCLKEHHNIRFAKSIDLDLKESIIFGILWELWAMPNIKKPLVLNKDIRYLDERSVIKSLKDSEVNQQKIDQLTSLIETIKKQSNILKQKYNSQSK